MSAPRWSPRQERAEGLKRRFYPTYLRDLVDYDYDAGLPDEARRWLAAFTEEHYRGWRLKREQQVTPLDATSRAAAATKERLRRRAHAPERLPEPPAEGQDSRNVATAMVDGLFRKRGGR